MATQKIRGNTQILDGTIENQQISASAGIETSKLADSDKIVLADQTNLSEDDILKYNSHTGMWGTESPTETYLPYGSGINVDSDGVKGQWSFGNHEFWWAIATNTWEQIATITYLQGNYVNLGNLLEAVNDVATESYVPSSLISNQDSDGIKGQWSFDGNYIYKCIATDTWIRYAVATEFTK